MAKIDDRLEEELRTFELFRHVPKKDLPRVSQMLGDPISVDAGHSLTEQGRMESDVYLIVDGTADVLVGGRPVAENGPGESVGEMAVVDHWPRSASVVARTPMRLYHLAGDSFLTMLDEVPTVARALAQLLSARLRRQNIRPPGY
jgi:CRP/FNR family transcriptional regulator, cyclic AMP receptor protein